MDSEISHEDEWPYLSALEIPTCATGIARFDGVFGDRVEIWRGPERVPLAVRFDVVPAITYTACGEVRE